MSKFLNIVEKYEKITKPLQIFIYTIIIASIIGTGICVALGLRSCSKPEITEAKYFISDHVIVHDNFEIEVLSARSVSKIEVLKKKNDTTKTSIDGNYIAIDIKLVKKPGSNEKDHVLDTNDFKLKDHTGVYIPLNTIMSFFNIDAVDMHIDTDENGFIKSDVSFYRKTAVDDYSWVGNPLSNEVMNITIYFKMSEGYKVEENVMVLEVDFYTGASGIKRGEDIVLVKCEKIDAVE